MTKSAIAAGVGVIAIAAAGLVAADEIAPLSATQATTQASTLPPPQNLRAYEVGPTQIKVSYGPSIVGPLSITPAPNGRSATIRWGGARDDLHPLGITYDFQKNGTYLWKNRQQTYANVGFTLAIRTFTTCVIPHSQNGYGPKRCVTWTGVK